MKLPEKFRENIISDLGEEEALKLFEALSTPPPVSIRLNPHKQTDIPFPSKPVPWCPEGHYLNERPIFTIDPLFHAGTYYVQEASSMFLAHVLNQITDNTPVKILDLCAAPGGKSTLISSIIPEGSLLVSNEVIKTRNGILQENLSRWGIPNFMVCCNDPRDFKKLKEYFDIIVVDAPCSGEGMFRKDPGSIQEWSEDHVELCSSRQQRILEDILPSLKPGGYLIYSTCTFNQTENNENIQRISSSSNLQFVNIPLNPAWNIVASAEGYHFFPSKIQGEGFFISCLRKKGEVQDYELNTKPSKNFPFLDKKLRVKIAEWMEDTADFIFYTSKDGDVYAVPEVHFKDYLFLSHSLYITYPFLHVGKFAGEKFIPSHDLALSVKIRETSLKIEINYETALAYLKKKDVSNDILENEVKDGWLLLCFKEKPIGWVKVIGNRVNNYYPKELRIMKDF